MIVAISYAVAVTGAGWIFVRSIGYLTGYALQIPRLVELLTSFSVGLGLYAGIWICVGLWGQLRAPIVLACLIPGLMGAAAFAAVGRIRAREAHSEANPLWNVLALIIGVILVLLAIAAFEPPAGDALAFYMAWPKVIAASGILTPLPGYEFFSSVWTVAEIHFAALMTWGGEPAAKFFIWLVVLASVTWMWELSALTGLELRGRVLSTCIVLTSTAFLLVSWDGKTDLLAVPPALAAVWWILSSPTPVDKLALILVGCLAGTSVAAKMSYAPSLGAILLVLVFWKYASSGGRFTKRILEALVAAGLIGIAATIILLPQVLKNQVLFGQPLYPVFYFAAGGVKWLSALMGAVWYSPSVTRRIVMTFPLAVSFGNYWAQYGVLSPLVIGLLPLLLLWHPGSAPPHSRLRWLTVSAIAGIGAWLAIAPSQMAPRYFLAPILLFAILPAWLGEVASREGPWTLKLAIPVSAIVVATGVAFWIYTHAFQAAQYTLSQFGIPVLGQMQGHSIKLKQIDDEVNARIPQGARILLGSYYRYFLRSDLLQCLVSVGDLDQRGLDADVIRRLGIEYVLNEKNGGTSATIDPNLVQVLYQNEDWTLYRVQMSKVSNTISPPRCVQSAEGRWIVQD
jgi:hypothetical protein